MFCRYESYFAKGLARYEATGEFEVLRRTSDLMEVKVHRLKAKLE